MYLHLIEAKLYDKACAVVVRDLVPEALLREDYALVKELLWPLSDVLVSDWQTTGQVRILFFFGLLIKRLPSRRI